MINKYCIDTKDIPSIYDSCMSIPEYVEYLAQQLNNKTDLYGDHKGSWQGIPAPVYSEPGIQGVVIQHGERLDKIENDIINLNTVIDNMQNELSSLDKKATVHFIDPDNSKNHYGDCQIVVDYNKNVYMIDTQDLGDEQNIEYYMSKNNITKIDKIFLTHLHNDHSGGAPYFIRKYKPKEIYFKIPDWSTLPPIEETIGWETKKYYDYIVTACEEVGTTIINLTTDKTFTLSENTFVEVINTANRQTHSYNAQATPFIFYMKNKVIVFPGDVEEVGESILTDKKIKIDLMSLHHKGNASGTAHSPEFIRTCRPSHVVGHFFNSTYCSRYRLYEAKEYMTSFNGSICFMIDDVISTDKAEYVIQDVWCNFDNVDYYIDRSTHYVQNGLAATRYNQLFAFKNGVLQTGWVLIANIYYYGDLNNGMLAENKILTIDNNKYYFHIGGRMATNEVIFYDGFKYQAGSNGVLNLLG